MTITQSNTKRTKVLAFSGLGLLIVGLLAYGFFSATAGWFYLSFQGEKGKEPSSIAIPISAQKLDYLMDTVASIEDDSDVSFIPNPFPAFFDSGPTKPLRNMISTAQIEGLKISRVQGIRVKEESHESLVILTGREVKDSGLGPLSQFFFIMKPIEMADGVPLSWSVENQLVRFIAD